MLLLRRDVTAVLLLVPEFCRLMFCCGEAFVLPLTAEVFLRRVSTLLPVVPLLCDWALPVTRWI
jgi:hypothetical protein